MKRVIILLMFAFIFYPTFTQETEIKDTNIVVIKEDTIDSVLIEDIKDIKHKRMPSSNKLEDSIFVLGDSIVLLNDSITNLNLVVKDRNELKYKNNIYSFILYITYGIIAVVSVGFMIRRKKKH